MVVAESEVVPHDFPYFEPEDPVVEAPLEDSVLFGKLQSLDQPVHLGVDLPKHFFASRGDFFFGVLLFAHEVFEVADCPVCFEYLFCDRTDLV